MRRSPFLLLAALALLLVPAPAQAGGPTMLVGAAEDLAKQSTLVQAKAELDLIRLAGFGAVRVTSQWTPDLDSPSTTELKQLKNLADAAALAGVRLYLAVYPVGSRSTPLTDEARARFAGYTAEIVRAILGYQDVIVGNEPNLNRFWLPQFNPDGTDAAAPAYLQLLAATYDALKAVSPRVNVIGGAVSPRGVDRPGTGRDTHSPTAFVADLGAAYRASGRTTPVMDAFSFHPYQDTSAQPPTFQHPNSTTITLPDYGKLQRLLATAFDGTAQPGSELPIVYGEFGVEAQIPAAKAGLYSGTEPATTRAVDEATQAEYYRQALAIAFCQPQVQALLVFHAVDEPALDRFQSGLYYADGTGKSSLDPFRAAARDVRGGVIAKCPGMELTPVPVIAAPSAGLVAKQRWEGLLTCDVDCIYYARLEKLPQHSTTLVARGKARAGEPTKVLFPARKLAAGQYRLTVRGTAPVNVGPPGTAQSRPFTVTPAPGKRR